MLRSDSTTSSGIGLSEGSSENLAASNDQVIIQTSRFEERCSTVFDSVKEIRYSDDAYPQSNAVRTHITTSSDLLSAFSTQHAAKENKVETSHKPVHRSRSFSGSGSVIEQNTTANAKSAKDDGFITGVATLTKSRPPAKIISNKNNVAEGESSQKNTITTVETTNQIFYNPSKDRPSLLPKSRSTTPTKDRISGLPVKGANMSQQERSGTLPNPAKDRLLSRNSRPKSYKIAVSHGTEGKRRYVEKTVSYDQIKSRGTPETDL